MRILSLAPNITETLFALGAGAEVVGVTDFCRYPEEAARKPRIGGLLNPDVERMFSLEPTLAIMLPAHAALAAKLERRGIATITLPNDTVDDVIGAIEAIGAATGREEAAGRLAGKIRGAVERARARKPVKEWTVMIVVDRVAGSLTGFYVAGPGTYLDEVIRLNGGKNAFGDALGRYPSPGVEEVLHRNPEVIIELQPGRTIRPGEETERLADWARLPGLDAAAAKRVFILTGDELLVPGPRVGRAIDEIGALLEKVR